jgi:hypothetical protein
LRCGDRMLKGVPTGDLEQYPSRVQPLDRIPVAGSGLRLIREG